MVFDILAQVLTVIFVGLLISYLTKTALRSKPIIDPATGARTFSYVSASKALALISLILPVFFGAFSLILYRAGDSAYLVPLILGLIFTAMTGYALLEYFVARLIVSDEGITSQSPWTGERFFRWDEIESIGFSKLLRWYVLIGPGRRKIYAAEYLSGFAYLTVEFTKKIPQEKWKDSKLPLTLN